MTDLRPVSIDSPKVGANANPLQDRRNVASGVGLRMNLSDTPFIPVRRELYGFAELAAGFDPGRPASFAETVDFAIYRHFLTKGGGTPNDSLASMLQALHDNSIAQALVGFLEKRKRVIAIMGGHKLRRDSPQYATVAHLARSLSREGCLLASGGGPGAMEATHLGALLQDASPSDLDDAIARLAMVPEMPDDAKGVVGKDDRVDPAKVEKLARWWTPAYLLRQFISRPGESLAVPTWYYGHEPYTPLATHIAKYFQNSIREDGLLALAAGGIVYTEGRAGTLQEVFQDAAQNYYKSVLERFSPMVFLGTKFWIEELPVKPLLRQLFKLGGHEAAYDRNVRFLDDPDQAVRFLVDRPAGDDEADLLKFAGLRQTAIPEGAGAEAVTAPPPALGAIPAPTPAAPVSTIATRTFRVASFNVENLLHPGAFFAGRPDDRPYDVATFDDKVRWAAGILDESYCDIVGFQEVFSSEALEAVVARSAYLSRRGARVVTPGYEGNSNGVPTPEGRVEFSGPNVALVTHLPVVEVTSIQDFPAAVRLTIPVGRDDEKQVPVDLRILRFERPVIRARVTLPGGVDAVVFVAHLKSKRPKFLEGEDETDPVVQALGRMRSLVIRAAEATALRALAAVELRDPPGGGPGTPVLVLGDLNDDLGAVTTGIVGGEPPMRGTLEQKRREWDVLLYSAHDLQEERSLRDVSFTHLYNGRHELLDHVFLSQEFVTQYPGRIAEVRQTRIFNDHLSDSRFADAPPHDSPSPGAPQPDRRRSRSDHGIPVTTIRMREVGGGGPA